MAITPREADSGTSVSFGTGGGGRLGIRRQDAENQRLGEAKGNLVAGVHIL